MKRLLCLSALLILSVTLSGCGVNLSEEQNRIIAEYAADLLLKYDRNYESQFEDADWETTTDTEAPDTTEATEATDTEAVSQERTTEEETETKDLDTPSTEASASTAAVSDETITDLAELIGMEGVSICYDSYSIVDYYPSYDQEGTFIYLEAEDGYQLLVVRFDLKNLTGQNLEVDLLNAELEYKLLMNGTKAARPMLTILIDDLGTYRSTIAAGDEQSAVLIFQISDALTDDIETLELQASYQERSGTIHIQ